MKAPATCLYTGFITHRRNAPVVHQFRYSLYMVCLDLDEVDELLARGWFWGTHRFAIHRFYREDHFGPPHQRLKDAVLDLVEERLHRRPSGAIRLLTNLRSWGYAMNPVSFYYCFNQEETVVDAIVAEVHNTPWGEMHCYVLDCAELNAAPYEEIQDKVFHVSPFMEMNMQYHWKVTSPAQTLSVTINNFQNGAHLFNAHLTATRRPWNKWTLFKTSLKHPWMTAKIITAIYWNALWLWCKGVKYVPHPDR